MNGGTKISPTPTVKAVPCPHNKMQAHIEEVALIDGIQRPCWDARAGVL